MAATSRKKGGGRGELRGGTCSASMHMGNYEPKAALVELGVGRERSRRKGRETATGELQARSALFAIRRAATRDGERAARREKGV